MKLTYEAYERSGKVKTGVIEVATPEEARQQLERQGLYVSRIGGAGDTATATKGGAHVGSRMPGGRRLKNLAVFTRQMAILVGSGTPVVDALRTLEKQTKDAAWKDAIGDIRIRVEEGENLSSALASHPRLFDPVARSLVSAGESSGMLDDMLNRLAILTRQQQVLRSTVIGAMVYPVLLMTVSMSVLALMLLFVLPRFTGLFETLDAPLPGSTKALMVLSDFLRGYWWGILPGVLGGAVGFYVWLKSKAGSVVKDRAMLAAPWLGGVTRSFLTARFARLLGMLLESRVPLLDALTLVRAGTTNEPFCKMLDGAEDAIVHGEPLSAVLASTDLVTDSVAEAVRNAENSGSVGPVLTSLADFIDEDNQMLVKSLSSIIEPLILIGLGIVVGFVALSMFLPLFDLTAMTGPAGPAPGGG